MGKLVSTFLLVAFMLISALANFGEAHVSAVDTKPPATETVALLDAPSAQSQPHLPIEGEDKGLAVKDECPCKQDHSASKYVCGVTLALADNPTALHSPTPGKARFIMSKSACVPDFVDRLKRPPRTIL